MLVEKADGLAIYQLSGHRGQESRVVMLIQSPGMLRDGAAWHGRRASFRPVAARL